MPTKRCHGIPERKRIVDKSSNQDRVAICEVPEYIQLQICLAIVDLCNPPLYPDLSIEYPFVCSLRLYIYLSGMVFSFFLLLSVYESYGSFRQHKSTKYLIDSTSGKYSHRFSVSLI